MNATDRAPGARDDGMATRLACAAVVVAIPLLLFRQVVAGDGAWIGNPDRLNSSLKVMLHTMRGIWAGRLDAWDESEMLGFDSFVLPYTFPNPLNWLSAAFGAGDFFLVQAWLSILLLMVAGFAALWFLRTIRLPWPEATVGTAVYQLSALTILKLSQNDMSFAVFIVIPIGMAIIRRARADSAVLQFLALTAAITALLHFMFLQKAAYALMLLAAYAVYRLFAERRRAPIVLFGAAAVVAIVVASPRILGIAKAIAEYAREMPGLDLTDFDTVHRIQNIWPVEIFRWLDGALFGISPSDAVRLHNNINLTEGFLLSAGPAIPLLLAVGIPLLYSRVAGAPARVALRRQTDAGFMCIALAFTVSVALFKPMTQLVFLLFLRTDFTHARILIAGLLPMCALVGIVLTCLRPADRERRSMAGLLAGLGLGIAIELIANRIEAPIGSLRADAVTRIVMSLAVSAVLIALILRYRRTRSAIAVVAQAALASLVVAQAFLAADRQVNGPQTSDRGVPFHYGDMYMAAPAEARLPSPEKIATLRATVHGGRVAIVCPADMAGGLCAAHIAEKWQLRAVDGYYGIGVPRRLRMLPWQIGVTELRSLSFTAENRLSWPLLGFLNVAAAVVADRTDEFSVDAADFATIDNPETVIPRAFLARTAEGVAGPDDALRLIFPTDRPVVDVRDRSYVEGLETMEALTPQAEVAVEGHGDRLEFDVSSTTGVRILIVNDLYFPGWRAFVDGIETPILPANVVMRAVPLPTDAKHVTMMYEPFVRSRTAGLIYLAGVILFFAGLLLAARIQTIARRQRRIAT